MTRFILNEINKPGDSVARHRDFFTVVSIQRDNNKERCINSELRGNTMNISENTYVAFDYKLSLNSGEEVDRSPEGQPLGIITGAGQIIPGLEKAMMEKKEGDNFQISVPSEEGYGQVNPELFRDIARSQFPGDIDVQPGMTFQADGPQGPMLINIKEIKDENTVVIDLNHPLAGKQLNFDINIVEVREPTAEEMSGLSTGRAGCGSREQGGCDTGGGCC